MPKVLGQKVRLFWLSELRVNLDAKFVLATAIVHDMLSWVTYIVSNSTCKAKTFKVYYQGLQTKPVSLREVLMAHILLRSFSFLLQDLPGEVCLAASSHPLKKVLAIWWRIVIKQPAFSYRLIISQRQVKHVHELNETRQIRHHW